MMNQLAKLLLVCMRALGLSNLSRPQISEKLKKRLTRWLTPTSFEHLVVDLLQLAHPNEKWLHVGRSGDGGADDLGLIDGKTSSVLQCKWKYSGRFDELATWLSVGDINVYVASLIHQEDFQGNNALTRSWFAEKIIEHKNRLPIASSLGIG